MIEVDRQLLIRSENGALQTVLDGAGTSRNIVSITASFTQFGTMRGGFTVTGSTRAGINVEADQGVILVGNVAVANRVGNDFGDGFQVTRGHGHLLTMNVAADNGGGFALFGDDLLVTRNVATSNFGGGFGCSGSRCLLRNNVSVGNQHGFGVDGPDHRLNRNSAIGNRLIGVSIQRAQPGEPATRRVVVTHTNIYGNNTLPAFPRPNCGMFNTSGATVIARNNYWGSANGPGPDPADFACPVEGDILIAPVAPQKFEILETALIMTLPSP